jgi:hypothetical protein
MANAAHFRKRTKAILIGQPIGEKPNTYQEAREMVLPNSGWVARYTLYGSIDSRVATKT